MAQQGQTALKLHLLNQVGENRSSDQPGSGAQNGWGVDPSAGGRISIGAAGMANASSTPAKCPANPRGGRAAIMPGILTQYQGSLRSNDLQLGHYITNQSLCIIAIQRLSSSSVAWPCKTAVTPNPWSKLDLAAGPSSVGNDLDANCLHVAALDDRPQGSHDRRTAAPSTHGIIPFAPEQLALSLFACIVLPCRHWSQLEIRVRAANATDFMLASSTIYLQTPFQQSPAACYSYYVVHKPKWLQLLVGTW
ncbi:hypothetical protein BO85DRAFT_473156 [Aspergillus piperis CBS 112811]|uniref:Uncharacterized protein n=1 Tax=Aspergillus piperis CBS 112811 TaxID=1448313 RepID=A0A8G1QT39_9EURO|nr:hypothetical protein BO85DRAFT_473156 [Aspergillus piperis CBS 112811]RAH51780.1 hypothetical protein BO85DRAFT_473156 [Aspergillus piperis CBS 112811]